MKQRWNSKYFKIGITAIMVIAAGLLIFYALFYASKLRIFSQRAVSVLMPVLDGLVIAYLLAPIVNFFEKKIIYPTIEKSKCNFKSKKHKRIIRMISILLTFLVVSFFIYQFFALIIPQIVNSIQSIIIQFPLYMAQITAWIEQLLQDNPDMEGFAISILDRYSGTIQDFLNTKLLPQMNSVVMTLSQSIIGVLNGIMDLIIGIIISIYLLSSKEVFSAQIKKVIYAMLERRTANIVIHDLRFTHKTFSGFINGKIIDSIIIGLLCFVCISAMGMPYTVLISVIIGVTNIIPFFGPYFGAIPSAFIILMIDPIKCLYFLIFILVLQQFDGNILGPKILGNSTGLSSFWVIFAITVFGGMWGVPGMIIGVPLFAVIYSGIRANTHRLLKHKNLPIATECYLNIGSINKDGHIIEARTKGNQDKNSEHDGFQWRDDLELDLEEEINVPAKESKDEEIVSKNK